VIDDFKQILRVTSPTIIYTHNLADKHDTHVAVVLRVIQALRELTPPLEDVKLYGCEVWRGLDWLIAKDRIALDISRRIDLQKALLALFESQIKDGKRYDLGTMGRRLANATFNQSHETDKADYIVYAVDLAPLIHHPEMGIGRFMITKHQTIQNVAQDVTERLNRLRK